MSSSSGAHQEFDHVIKIVFVGDSAVGKSSMMCVALANDSPPACPGLRFIFPRSLFTFISRIFINIYFVIS